METLSWELTRVYLYKIMLLVQHEMKGHASFGEMLIEFAFLLKVYLTTQVWEKIISWDYGYNLIMDKNWVFGKD